MSTAGPLDSQFQPRHVPVMGTGPAPHPSGGGTDMGTIDPVLIQQTKNEIRSLVGKQQACEALGDTAGVEDTAARISRLRGD